MLKTVEQTYQKKTPLEHVLLRPDTYVGSIEMEKCQRWVVGEGQQFQYKQIQYVPALYKIFDEVLVNAADNYQRDSKMNLLKVQIVPNKGMISVYNNGKGIPVTIHKEEKIYVPEMIFGHLLTGSNYDDNEKKVVGGRNGYGAKLANIFSLKFIVECGDGTKGKKFKMEWRNNMTSHGQPQISPYQGRDYVIVTFYPDLKRFNMQQLNDDIVSILRKRVYDMAGLMPKVKTYINDYQIPVSSFLKYVDMYFPPQSTVPKIFDKEVDNERWQIVVSFSDGQFKQCSFVNGICTSKGGTHVNYIVDQIVDKIQEKIKKKDKNVQVKPFQVKSHLWVFVNCLVQNPAFDSQTKQTLTLKVSQFGSKCELSQKMIKEILKSGIVDDIVNEAKQKQLAKLAKMNTGGKKGRITGVPKLEDANEAGTRNSQRCTLILTEGDSAKGMALSGIEVVGRDYYGVFPLKGKLLNVRDASPKVLTNNEQIQAVLKIIGLQIGKTYEDLKSLRYGSIMIMADQDADGSHIKGLVINFIHTFWPSLFVKAGFLKQFITPILKAAKGRQVISFYTIYDYKEWLNRIDNIKLWKVKYYKGLGTSTDKEAKQYFQDIDRHKIQFEYGGPPDDESIELIFSKKKIQERKQWLSHYDPTLSMVYDRPAINYRQFVHRQFIHFSNGDNIRSIASVVDGFKPGQRKIIYSCFKRNLKQEIKVAQLAGYVSQHSAYHHGQMSLTQCIVGMAQDFIGSNNINLLMPNGQFGSRNQGGKEHASARYIFTCLNRITRYIFPESDDHVLTYVEDDGQLVEPEYYIPIIPMVLINGCQGIGTGWSTFIPNFNPKEIAQILLRKINGEQREGQNIQPWYRGYDGQMVISSASSIEMKGILQVDTVNCRIHIKQLPVGRWTKDHKQFLDELMSSKPDKIIGLREHHTKSKVHFQLEVSQDFIQTYKNDTDYLEKFFKTNANMSLNNMVAFNPDKKIVKYPNVMNIINEFYALRLHYYHKRKQYLISRLKRDATILTMKEKFILEIVQETINIRNKKKIEICQVLRKKGYLRQKDIPKIISTKLHKDIKQNQEEANGQEQKQQDQQKSKKQQSSSDYNYLLSMPLWSLSYEKVEEIKRQRKEKQLQMEILVATSLEQLWKNDIQQFLKVYEEVLIEDEKLRIEADKKVLKDGKMKKPRKRADQKPKKKEEKNIDWDSDYESKNKNKNKDVKDKSKEKKKKVKNQSQSKEKDKKKQLEQDFFARIKKKYNANSNQQQTSKEKDSGFSSVIKPKTGPKGLNAIKQIGKQDEFQVVKRQKPKKKLGKKKMSIDDSDSEESVFTIGDDQEYND